MYEGWAIASKVLAVFAVMAAGILSRRLGWLTRDADRSLMKLAVNVTLPALFFYVVVSDRNLARAAEVTGPPLVGFGTTVAGFAVAGLLAAALGRWTRLRDPSQRRAFTLCTGMYNYGYIPLPIAMAFFPDAVTTLILHNVGVDVAMWTVGLIIISGSIGWDALRRLINPPVIAISIALAIAFSGLAPRVPAMIIDGTHLLGQASIPLGLILSGAVIYDLWSEGEWLAEWRSFALAALVRLLLLPAAFLAFARYADLSESLRIVVMLQAAMPAATFPIVITKMYSQHTPTAFRIVVGTTALGVITIPLWIAAGCWYLGIALPR